MKLIDQGAVKRLAVLGFVLLALAVGCWLLMIRMPGRSYRGAVQPLSDEERSLAKELRQDVNELAGAIGERNMLNNAALGRAADFIEGSFKAAGYDVRRQTYMVAGEPADNLEAEIRGTEKTDEIVIVGAHYDSVAAEACPGANDNASGVAGILALARRFAGRKLSRTLRFVAFANEEPPYFWTGDMGSRVYARHCRRRGDTIVAMLSLETIGYYSDERSSQHYPPPLGLLYPATGNFIAFVGDIASRRLVHQVIGSFRRHAEFPSEGIAAPRPIPGIGWSDHWGFWEEGYHALMVTDTAPFRYPYYHTSEDTVDKVDFERMARVVLGLGKVVEDLAGGAGSSASASEAARSRSTCTLTPHAGIFRYMSLGQPRPSHLPIRLAGAPRTRPARRYT